MAKATDVPSTELQSPGSITCWRSSGGHLALQERMDFLKKDLDNLFNDRGVDQSQYDDKVNFMDPITKYSSVKGG